MLKNRANRARSEFRTTYVSVMFNGDEDALITGCCGQVSYGNRAESMFNIKRNR